MLRTLRIISVSLAALLLSGCWDKLELNDRAYVNGVSIDTVASEKKDGVYMRSGDEQNFLVGMTISDLNALEGSESGGEEAAEDKSIKKSMGSTVSAAIALTETHSSQRMFFGHTKAILFGQELLKDSDRFKEALDALERDRELSRKIIVMASEDSAVGTIGANPQGEPSISIFVDKYYKQDKSGFTKRMNLEELFAGLRNCQNAIIPKIKKENDEVKIGGGAVIKNMTFSGFIDEKTMRGYLWQYGKLDGTGVMVKYNNVSLPFSVLEHSKKISFYEDADGLVISVYVHVDGNVDEYKFGRIIYNEQTLRELEAIVASEIEKEISGANGVFQNRLKADAADVLGQLKKKNYKLWLKYKSNWQEVFEGMGCDVLVDAKIRGVGLIK